MTKQLHMLALVFAFALAWTAVVRTQDAPPAQPAKTPSVLPLKVQVVVSRYQGEKRISSMPYTLSMNGAGTTPQRHANLRMGAKIPVMMVAAAVVGGEKMPTAGPIQYQEVGTNIDCDVNPIDDGRFVLTITVDDSSVYPEEKTANSPTSGSPTFRSFRAMDSLVLKDGGTAQFTTATDKVNGEIVKVDVTLTVVK